MSTPNPRGMTLEAIRSVPLFASLHDQPAQELASFLRTRDVPAGTPLFRAGDKGDAMYLIQSGRVRIAVSDEEDKEILLAVLAQGDFFGEMAIIDGKQRSAGATVIEDARLSVLSREDFLRFINSNPGVAKDRLRADLDYQVNLKNEIALNEVLRRLDVLESERLPTLFAQQNERLVEISGGSSVKSISAG